MIRIKRGSDVHKAIQEAVFAKRVKAGDVSGIVKTPVGYHILKVVEKPPPRIVPFEKVAGQIKTSLDNERFEEGRKNYVKKLRERYTVVKYDDCETLNH